MSSDAAPQAMFDQVIDSLDHEIASVQKVLRDLTWKRQRIVEAREVFLTYVHKDAVSKALSHPVNAAPSEDAVAIVPSDDKQKDGLSLETKILEVFRYYAMGDERVQGLTTRHVIDVLLLLYGNDVAKPESIQSTLSRMANRETPALRRIDRLYYLATEATKGVETVFRREHWPDLNPQRVLTLKEAEDAPKK